MNDVAHGNQQAPQGSAEPHQQSTEEKKHAAHDDGPEIKFLPAVEETNVFRLNLVLVGRVCLDPFEPATVGLSPHHWRAPIKKLKQEEDVEEQTDPGVQRPGHRSAAENRR